MTKQSVEKLQDAGYVFIRMEERVGNDGKKKHIIKQSAEFGVWKNLETFDTRAACMRRLRELDENPFMIISQS